MLGGESESWVCYQLLNWFPVSEQESMCVCIQIEEHVYMGIRMCMHVCRSI